MEHYVNDRQNPTTLVRVRTEFAPVEMWIPHRKAWIEVRGFEDLISPFSSYQGLRATDEEAELAKTQVSDRSEEWILKHRA